MSPGAEPTPEALRRVAAIVAALLACEGGAVAVRVRPMWPELGPWTWLARRDGMQGGGRW